MDHAEKINACLSCEVPGGCNESDPRCLFRKDKAPVQIERRKKYYADNAEKIRKRKADWQAANIERVLAYQRERYKQKALERYHATKPPSREERRRQTLEML